MGGPMPEPLPPPTPADPSPAHDPSPPPTAASLGEPPCAAEDLDDLRLGAEDLAAALAGEASTARDRPRLDNPRRGRRLVHKADQKALALPPARRLLPR